MRIDSSGRVGIGTSNPSGSLEINGSGTGRPCLVLKGGNSTTGDLTIPKGEILQAGHWDEATTTFTQRMCIQADGDFGVGTNSNLVSSTSGGGFWINHSDVTAGNDYGVFARDNSSSSALFINKTNGDTTNNDMLDFRLDGSSKGHIDYNSGVIRYNTTSDYRLKDNITPMSGSIDRLKSLKPCNYNFLSDPDVIHDGFIAHEVQEVVVGAATGTKDGMTTEEYEVTPEVEAVLDADGNVTTEAVEAVMGTREVPDYQGIDQSKLVPLLVASLQEAIVTINNVESNVSDGTITSVHWSASITDGDYTASSYGSAGFTRDEESPTLIPFADVTEVDVVAWVTASLDENLEANLLADIESQKNPTSVSGVPWVAEEAVA